MKRILLTVSLAILSLNLLSQVQVSNEGSGYGIDSHSFRDFTISASTNLLFNTPNGMQLAGGLRLRMFIGRYISFDADFLFGRDYLHVGPGIIGVPIWMLIARPQGISSEDSEHPLSDLLFYGAAMLLAAEHTTFHIPAGNSLDISPYVSLLRYKLSYPYGDYNDPRYEGEQMSFAAGVELNRYFNKFVLSPYAEWNIGYVDHLSGFNIGVYLGYYFQNKR